MSKFVIEGKNRLCGEIDIQGAKNSVLPVLAATLLFEGISVIHNCPELSDVDVAIKILSFLGCKCKRENDTVIVDAINVNCDRIPDDLMREMRSSVMFLGAILARCSSAVISSPGGCELGPRPIDLHISSFLGSIVLIVSFFFSAYKKASFFASSFLITSFSSSTFSFVITSR